jgi:hypothetical protein
MGRYLVVGQLLFIVHLFPLSIFSMERGTVGIGAALRLIMYVFLRHAGEDRHPECYIYGI